VPIIKKSLGTKKLVAFAAVTLAILGLSTFTVLENLRRDEEKARLALQQQKLEAIQTGHKMKACGTFGLSLNLLTSNDFSSKKMKEANSLLNDNLQAWSMDNGGSKKLYNKLSKYHGVVVKSLSKGDPRESKDFKAFQKSNFTDLISSCNLTDSYTYPGSITFISGCEINQVKNLEVELQKKSSSNSWTKIATKPGVETDYCKAVETVGYLSKIGAAFSIDLGLVRNDLASYGTYRVLWHFKGGPRYYDGKRELISCEFKAKKPDDIRYPDTDTQWVAGDSDGCKKTYGPDPEPENEDVPAEIDPWSRDFSNEWLEGTAKFIWCWNRGLEYSSEADACY